MNKSTFIFLFVSLVFISTAFADKDRTAYIKKYKPVAVEEMKKNGIPASIKIAQGILESGCGKSTLAVKANNHFGIKSNGWTGRTYCIDDDRPNEAFRKYSSPEQSWHDHSLFLTTRSRYDDLFKLKKDDYKGWAYGLKAAGYATNPRYAQMLIKIIEEERLYEIDEEVLADSRGNKHHYHEHNLPFWSHDRKYDSPFKSRIRLINGVKCIVVEDGDSFNAISSSARVSVRKLLKYNDRHSTALTKGEVIYLQSKKTKAAKGYDFHTVKVGDNLLNIAQRYGVKADNLVRYNFLDAGSKLYVGQKLYLRSSADVL